jgi:hypothetical protein
MRFPVSRKLFARHRPQVAGVLAAGVGVLSVLTAALAFGSPDQTAHFLNFTVKDRRGIYIRDLKPDEVTLRLNGQPVDVRYLGGRDVQTATAVILENSPRTASQPVSIPQWGQINPIDRIRYLLLDDFFPQLTASGEVMLAQFFREFEVIHAFTGDDSVPVMAIQEMQLNFTGVVLDNIHVGRALARGVDLLKRVPARRKLLILFTAAIDRDGYQNLEEYQELLRQSDAELYTISFAPRFASSAAFSFEEKMTGHYFRILAGETGGRAYLVSEYTYLDELFTDLKGRIANTYTAGFYPPGGAEEFEVEIQISREKCQIAHRKRLVAKVR